jgi:hypothetical protein
MDAVVYGLLDYDSFFKTFLGLHATFSVYRRVVTLTVAVLINPCLHYMLWLEFPPLMGFASGDIFTVPVNHR